MKKGGEEERKEGRKKSGEGFISNTEFVSPRVPSRNIRKPLMNNGYNTAVTPLYECSKHYLLSKERDS